MKNGRIITLLLVVAYGLSCNGVEVSPEINQKRAGGNDRSTQPLEGPFSPVSDDQIQFYGKWDAGDDSPLNYRVWKSDAGEKFVVTNALGKVLFEEQFFQVYRVYAVWALRTEISQLVLEFSEGGQDSFVQMLSYKGGKIVKIINDTNGSNSFGAGLIIQPQFRTGVNPAKEPFEILLTDHGLSSPVGKFTRVLRYTDGEYRVVGKFDRGKVADFKESVLASQ